jgi:hypothetical protein
VETNKSQINLAELVDGIIIFNQETYLVRTGWYMLITDVAAWAQSLLANEREELRECLDDGDIETAEEHSKTIRGFENWLMDYRVPDERTLLPYLSFAERQRMMPLMVTRQNCPDFTKALLGKADVLEPNPDSFSPCFCFDSDNCLLMGTKVIRPILKWCSDHIRGFLLG